jgi:hypothetical protein
VALLGARARLADQARLADPRLARDRDHPGLPAVQGVERPFDDIHLGPPAHQHVPTVERPSGVAQYP